MKRIDISKIILKPLEQIDIDEIINLEKEQDIEISTKLNLSNSFNSNTEKYIIAWYNNIIVGYFGISISIDFIDILSICTKNEFKKNGIASLLLRNIISIANTNNIQKIFLEVRVSNIAAQNLYKKFGFEQINVRKNYYPDNFEDAIILMKKCY